MGTGQVAVRLRIACHGRRRLLGSRRSALYPGRSGCMFELPLPRIAQQNPGRQTPDPHGSVRPPDACSAPNLRSRSRSAWALISRRSCQFPPLLPGCSDRVSHDLLLSSRTIPLRLACRPMGGSGRPKPSPISFFPAACGGFLAPLRFKKAARSGPPLSLRPCRVQAVRTRPLRSAIAGDGPRRQQKETSK